MDDLATTVMEAMLAEEEEDIKQVIHKQDGARGATADKITGVENMGTSMQKRSVRQEQQNGQEKKMKSSLQIRRKKNRTTNLSYMRQWEELSKRRTSWRSVKRNQCIRIKFGRTGTCTRSKWP